MYNPIIVEQIANQRLAELRAEGMRSQELARAGLYVQKKIDFSGVARFFRRMAAFGSNINPRRFAHPRIRKTIPQNDCK